MSKVYRWSDNSIRDVPEPKDVMPTANMDEFVKEAREKIEELKSQDYYIPKFQIGERVRVVADLGFNLKKHDIVTVKVYYRLPDQVHDKIGFTHNGVLYNEPVYMFESLPESETSKEGLRYNKGKLRWRNFPMFLLRPVVEVGDKAEKREGNDLGKYPTLNFMKGLKVQDTLDCLHRHLDCLIDPNQPDIDPEDGSHHLAKIAWNALVALYYIQNKPEFDDRELKYEEPK